MKRSLSPLALLCSLLFLISTASADCPKPLTKELIEKSLSSTRNFILNNQLSAGNFEYEYDWLKRASRPGDNQVRQAGTLWSLALLAGHYKGNQKIQSAFSRSLDFFRKNSVTLADGRRIIAYPKERQGSLGTVALVSLALVDGIRAKLPKDATEEKLWRSELEQYLAFIRSQAREESLWSDRYRLSDGHPQGTPSPYSSGEALLALVKAAKYLNYKIELSELLHFADLGQERFVEQALKIHPDSDTTKGYSQWGSMAYYELATSGWKDTERFGIPLTDLAVWMIDVHKAASRQRNNGYAFESILHALAWAKQKKQLDLVEKFSCLSQQRLQTLISWQVGGPIPNEFIRKTQTEDPKALGGVQNAAEDPVLRIDVTQHQAHALILALRYLL